MKTRELSIVFVAPGRMRTLNRKYLKHDYVTDVLSFDLGEGMAEIIICPYLASVNANIYRTGVGREIVLYVVHGILHLAGFDDSTQKDVARMRRMERELS